MGKGAQKVLEGLAIFVGLIFCGFMVWKGSAMAMHAFHYGERMSTAIGTPFVIPYMMIPIGFGVMFLQYVLQLVRMLTGAPDPAASMGAALAADQNSCIDPNQVL